MRSSAFFLNLLLLSEASAAGSLRRRERDIIIYSRSILAIFTRGSGHIIVVLSVGSKPILYPSFNRRCFHIYIIGKQRFSG
ncbi:hypothetical protein PG997_003409 [Apiospora hydei]|uniref:Secreted protein n=1 Tax=Apiospora hydei TaxID=1337664 RepID=A0ABR1WZ60_9PEZI